MAGSIDLNDAEVATLMEILNTAIMDFTPDADDPLLSVYEKVQQLQPK